MYVLTPADDGLLRTTNDHCGTNVGDSCLLRCECQDPPHRPGIYTAVRIEPDSISWRYDGIHADV